MLKTLLLATSHTEHLHVYVIKTLWKILILGYPIGMINNLKQNQCVSVKKI